MIERPGRGDLLGSRGRDRPGGRRRRLADPQTRRSTLEDDGALLDRRVERAVDDLAVNCSYPLLAIRILLPVPSRAPLEARRSPCHLDGGMPPLHQAGSTISQCVGRVRPPFGNSLGKGAQPVLQSASGCPAKWDEVGRELQRTFVPPGRRPSAGAASMLPKNLLALGIEIALARRRLPARSAASWPGDEQELGRPDPASPGCTGRVAGRSVFGVL